MMHQQSRGRNISPLSIESNESAFIYQYQNLGTSDSAYDNAPDHANHASPPLSQPLHNSSSTNNSNPSRRTPSGSKSHSSSSSVARSNDGSYHSPGTSEVGGIVGKQVRDDALQEHYRVLRNYLSFHGQRDMNATRPTRARDKLLRLSVTQFQELSTDVYDELLRREDDRQRRGAGVPKYLLPKTTFHPKRNQARQKLSTLPPDRFRQLATDVFYELERRVPRFAGADIERVSSPTMSTVSMGSSHSRGTLPNGMRPPPNAPVGQRGPPPVRPPRLDSAAESLYEPYHSPDSTNGNDYGRPLPKTFQSNTIVPNKSTLVEDDETDEDDAFGLERVALNFTNRSPEKDMSSHQDRQSLQAHEARVASMQLHLSELEHKLLAKDAEFERLEAMRRNREQDLVNERQEWIDTRGDMEVKISELQADNERARQSRNQVEDDLHTHMDITVSELQARLGELSSENDALRKEGSSSTQPAEGQESWRTRCYELQEELATQQRLTTDVMNNATQFLKEMRLLSAQSDAALEKEEQLRTQIALLEAEVEEWKSRYAKTKTQLRTLKASSIGLSLQRMAGNALSSRQALLSESGQVNDMDVTNFQISIDELLQAARSGSGGGAAADQSLEKMKEVVAHVRAMTGDGSNSEFSGLPSPGSPNLLASQSSAGGAVPGGSAVSSLRARVARSANSLITATRNHATSNGLSPVSLLDAAADNLTAAVVDYLKVVGVRPTPLGELQHDGDGEDDYGYLAPVAHVPALSLQPGANAGAKAVPSKQHGWFSRLRGESTLYSGDGPTIDDGADEYESYR